MGNNFRTIIITHYGSLITHILWLKQLQNRLLQKKSWNLFRQKQKRKSRSLFTVVFQLLHF
jgi:hypothetical protein